MKYVEFYDTTGGKAKKLGEIQLKGGRLDISEDLVPHWDRAGSYGILGMGGYGTMYDPEKILAALPGQFQDPAFKASEVKER
jgi:hypothetical protein